MDTTFEYVCDNVESASRCAPVLLPTKVKVHSFAGITSHATYIGIKKMNWCCCPEESNIYMKQRKDFEP